MQRACTVICGVNAPHAPGGERLYAGAVQPFEPLMNESAIPADPSAHMRLRKPPQPTTAVPAGQLAATFWMHDAVPGLHPFTVVATVVTVLPGPVAPVGPVTPAAPVAPVAPVAPIDPVAPGAPVGPAGPVAPVAPVGPVNP